MKILCLYDATQTYTNTVFDHLRSLEKLPGASCSFFHFREQLDPGLLETFDGVIIHYSIRLPFDMIYEPLDRVLQDYTGLKALFIQDEYDHTHRTWHWIQRLGLHLVFSVVPEQSLATVYPPQYFPNTRFVTNFTGYAPENTSPSPKPSPPSRRKIIAGYRGRPLPIRYGALGQAKVEIGRLVKQYCDARRICCDISWSEEDRIYGPAWNKFLYSCRATLGTESGSNVFDWDGTLAEKIRTHLENRADADDAQIYREVIQPLEQPGLMNQVSPRIFEAISARSISVLYEGHYSGVLTPGEHYLPLRQDGKNLPEIFSFLKEGKKVDAMAQKAYDDIIASGKYSYDQWIRFIGRELMHTHQHLPKRDRQPALEIPPFLTDHPIAAETLRRTQALREGGITKLAQVMAARQLRGRARKLLSPAWRFSKKVIVKIKEVQKF